MDAETVQYLSELVNKYVEIVLFNSSTVYTGIVKSADPVSQNIVLTSHKNNENPTIRIVMKDAIKSITILNEVPDGEKIILNEPKKEVEVNEKNIRTLDDVTQWLSANHIEFTVSGSSINVEGVDINPPYGVENCLGTNVTVLGRVQKLLQRRFSMET